MRFKCVSYGARFFDVLGSRVKYIEPGAWDPVLPAPTLKLESPLTRDGFEAR